MDDENETTKSRNAERWARLGFKPQKEVFCNKYLPYADALDEESNKQLAWIKVNLAKAVALREMNPGVGVFASELLVYIKLYGMKFSKEDHVKFIKIFLELITIPNLEPAKVNKFCMVLGQLLKKTYYLSPDDLQVDWRPLYELSNLILNKNSSKGDLYRYFPTLEANLQYCISQCSIYFSKSAPQEILDELLPRLQPLDIGKNDNVFEMCSIFLGTIPHGHELWFKHFMGIWETYHNPPWSADMMNLMSCCAAGNIGVIDWEPYIPIMFTRILRAIDLPVSYKNLKSFRNQGLWPNSIANWIVSVLGPHSSAQNYLDKFMSTIESYLHPANTGKWVMLLSDILVQLLQTFFDRLIAERYKKHPWRRPIPDHCKLTEDCITRFVTSVKPVALQTMFSRVNPQDIYKIFKHLADLRPQLIIPEVIDRVYQTLDSLTEPHKMTAALQCLVSVSRALVTDKNYTTGRTHVIPIFLATLPGIDPNDIRKTAVTLQFFTSFALSVPIVDCSKAGQFYDDLTEEESLICEQTAEFEDFVLQFLDRIFVLIEASASESTRLEQTEQDGSRSRLESFAEGLIQGSSHAVFGQCSAEIAMSAADKVLQFVKTHLLEPRVAAPLVGCLVRIFARVVGEGFLQKLMPYLVDTIQQYFLDHDDLVEAEKQRDELLYYLTVLTNAVRGNPSVVINYVEEVLPLVDYVFKFKCKTATRLASQTISNLLNNLSTLQTLDIRSAPDCYTKPLSECLPIRHWGEKMKPDSKIVWYVPDEPVRAVCERILHHFLPPILASLEAHVDDSKPLTREEIQKHLEMIMATLRCGNLLPNWSHEEPFPLLDTVVDTRPVEITLGFNHLHVNMPNGENVRFAIVQTLDRLQAKILAASEDDIKSLRSILLVWDRVSYRKHTNSPFDTQLKSFNVSKVMQDFRLTKNKRDVRTIVATRVIMQQDCRDELSTPAFTPTHQKIMLNVLRLATSHYSAVRQLAQSKLNLMLSSFAFSYKAILSDLVVYLRLDSNEHHEAFKGALYVLGSSRRSRLIVKHNWDCIEELWITLLQTKLSEKPSVLRLLDALSESIHNEFPTLSTRIEISDRAVEAALLLLAEGSDEITPADIAEGKRRLAVTGDENEATYKRIIHKIMEIVRTKQLHWRYSLLASTMIFNLVHPLTHYPTEVAEYFVQNLIHDSIQERKLAVRIVNYVMKQHKREHPKVVVDPYAMAGVERPTTGTLLKPGNREDNQWLQYEVEKVPKTQAEWDESRYFYKTNGYFGWSQPVYVYAPSAEQPPLDRAPEAMSDVERVVFNFFNDQSHVDKLVEYWALEEKKGKDKFNRSRFLLIKSLCNAFGDRFVDSFFRHLPRLIEDKTNVEGNHRAAAEIFAGFMRGTKHWPYAKAAALYERVLPLIRLALNKITVETDVYWGTCFATASENMDPYKQWWLHEVLLEDPLQESTSFIDCGRLYCLQGAFNQHVWRMNSVAHRLLDYLRPYLNHSFQNVRERIGSTLINIFEGDLQFAGGPTPRAPRVQLLFDEVRGKFEILLREQMQVDPVPAADAAGGGDAVAEKKDTEYDVSVRLFKTIAQWVVGILNRCTNGNETPYFDLLPIACKLERNEADTELADICTSLLAMVSQALTLPDRVEGILDKIDETTAMVSWSARLAVLDVLQVLVFHNMAIFLSRDEWVQRVQAIVLRLLEDAVLEVREKAGEVLCGLLHCTFLPATDKLLEHFKHKCKTKVIKSGRRPQTSSATASSSTASCSMEANREGTDAVRIRHTGVLGLCAFISAYPYDVPDFVPNVFEHLGAHLNDPQPIPSTIRKTMGDFKRTHHDNWNTHQLKFTEDQLAVLSDLTVPPSYYA